MTLGFYLASAVFVEISTKDIIIILIVGVISFPIISIALDHYGRKPIAFLTLFLLAIISLFFDYPDKQFMIFDEIRIAIYSFSGLLILIMGIVLAGDLSSKFARGKITGIFLLAIIVGTIIGSLIRTMSLIDYDFEDPLMLVRVSDWATLLIVTTILLMNFAVEPFQEHTQEWRHFLHRLYLFTPTGIAICAKEFRSPNQISNSAIKRIENNPKEKSESGLNEDLVSGGLMGLQTMLKEISQSQQYIRILDHGDLQLIFHYGEYSTAVLFVERDLFIFREKLAEFHLQFEYQNQIELKNFIGKVSGFHGIDALFERYFL
jgi:MFS family permease